MTTQKTTGGIPALGRESGPAVFRRSLRPPARRVPRRGLGLAVLLCAAAGAACSTNEPTYYPFPGALEVGVPDDMGNAVNLATGMVFLPFRQPTAEERKEYADEGRRLGYKLPWLQARNLPMEIAYTITNLDSKEGTAEILVDGADEFTNYDTSLIRTSLLANAKDKNPPIVLSLVQETPVTIPKGGTLRGIVREEEIVEAALDLDAIGRFMAPFAAVLINRSEVNRIGMEMVPKGLVVPAFFRLALSFSADVHMRCAFTVRVRDRLDQIQQKGEDLFLPAPVDFVPPVMP